MPGRSTQQRRRQGTRTARRRRGGYTERTDFKHLEEESRRKAHGGGRATTTILAAVAAEQNLLFLRFGPVSGETRLPALSLSLDDSDPIDANSRTRSPFSGTLYLLLSFDVTPISSGPSLTRYSTNEASETKRASRDEFGDPTIPHDERTNERQ